MFFCLLAYLDPFMNTTIRDELTSLRQSSIISSSFTHSANPSVKTKFSFAGECLRSAQSEFPCAFPGGSFPAFAVMCSVIHCFQATCREPLDEVGIATHFTESQSCGSSNICNLMLAITFLDNPMYCNSLLALYTA